MAGRSAGNKIRPVFEIELNGPEVEQQQQNGREPELEKVGG